MPKCVGIKLYYLISSLIQYANIFIAIYQLKLLLDVKWKNVFSENIIHDKYANDVCDVPWLSFKFKYNIVELKQKHRERIIITEIILNKYKRTIKIGCFILFSNLLYKMCNYFLEIKFFLAENNFYIHRGMWDILIY